MDAVFIQDGFSCKWHKLKLTKRKCLDLRLSDPGTSKIKVLLLGLCLTMRFSHRLVSTKHYSPQREPPHGRQDGCQEPCSRKCPSLHINVRGKWLVLPRIMCPALSQSQWLWEGLGNPGCVIDSLGHVPIPEPITRTVGGIRDWQSVLHNQRAWLTALPGPHEVELRSVASWWCDWAMSLTSLRFSFSSRRRSGISFISQELLRMEWNNNTYNNQLLGSY